MLKYAPPVAITQEWSAMHETFGTGIIAQLYFAFPHWLPSLQDPSKSKVVNKMGFDLCPVNAKYWKSNMPRGYVDQEGFSISPYTKYPEAVWLFMQYTMEKPIDRQRALTVGCGMRTSTLNMAELEAMYRKKDGADSWINLLKYWRDPEKRKYNVGSDVAIGEYGAINDIWDKWFYKVYTGELDAKQATKDVAKELDDRFHELGYW